MSKIRSRIIFGKYRVLNRLNLETFSVACDELLASDHSSETDDTQSVSNYPPADHIEFLKGSDNTVKMINIDGKMFEFKHNKQTVYNLPGGISHETKAVLDEGTLYLVGKSRNAVVNAEYRFLSAGSNRVVAEIELRENQSSTTPSNLPQKNKGLISRTSIIFEKFD